MGRALDLPALPWLLFLLIGGGTTLALWLNRELFSQVRSEPPEPSPAPATGRLGEKPKPAS